VSERLDEYLKHKAAGTAPKKGIPYTKQSRVREEYLFPGKATAARGVSEYIKAFEQLNNLKEIPQ
jgi:hypothetical protein